MLKNVRVVKKRRETYRIVGGASRKCRGRSGISTQHTATLGSNLGYKLLYGNLVQSFGFDDFYTKRRSWGGAGRRKRTRSFKRDHTTALCQ